VTESDSARRLQMRFEWDENKNRENRKKHRVSFEIAMEVFDDPFASQARIGLLRVKRGFGRWAAYKISTYWLLFTQ
jgi:Ribonuclease toxin, BrnT, of type II toxin-antitoxin system